MAQLIQTIIYDVSAWRGYRGETSFTVGSRTFELLFLSKLYTFIGTIVNDGRALIKYIARKTKFL